MSQGTLPSYPLTFEFAVEPYLSGVRIDSFLAKHLRNYTSWRLHRMVSAGLATIDDLPADPIDRVFPRQRVAIRLVEPPDKLLEPEPGPIEVVYEDPWVIVIDKPAGLIAHPSEIFRTALFRMFCSIISINKPRFADCCGPELSIASIA